MGAHGTLEWLPGKAVALTASCFPEAVLGSLPVIYPFIVSNPGEAAQAKRRIGVGFTGLGDALVMLNLPYNSAAGREMAARIACTLLHAMQDRDVQFGLATMCIGIGQGIARCRQCAVFGNVVAVALDRGQVIAAGDRDGHGGVHLLFAFSVCWRSGGLPAWAGRDQGAD